jgi:alginate O-acetyltransferase complex protein AlgI
MIFSSYEFLFLFLPLVLAGYYLLPQGGRTLFLTLASYLFYGWWDYRFCGLMLVSTVIDYAAGQGISRAQTQRGKKQWVTLSIISNLSLLGFFKYFDMFASTVNHGFSTLLHSKFQIPNLHLVLPVGISFYTFQSMSYAIDLYKGRARQTRSFLDFACYVSLFPQLVAGPIVRYHEVAGQLIQRVHSWPQAAVGGSFFILGLAKKILLADGVAPLADFAFGVQSPGLMDAWIGVLAYTLQIYFDFSGYSDMAVGLGLMIGFRFPQNFDSPYKATSITDFWRRWHISLSSWLRDYLYVPLGGNRRGKYRTYFNLMLTMLLGGLWHGANWTFVVWGLFHGVLLAVERAMGKTNLLAFRPVMVQRSVTLILVMIGWVFFRATTMTEAWSIISGMTGWHGIGGAGILASNQDLSLIMLPVSLLLVWLAPNSWQIRHDGRWPWLVLLVFLFVVSVMVMLVNDASPFLYFQF